MNDVLLWDYSIRVHVQRKYGIYDTISHGVREGTVHWCQTLDARVRLWCGEFEICGRVKDLGCSEWFPSIFERLICECISRSRTMEVALVICCAYEWDWNYMRWMAVDVDLDHKNDDSHVIGCWSVVVWRAMMYTGGDRDWTAPWGELESFFLGILWRGLANQNGCCYVSTNERRYYGATTGQ